jgi:tRNA threonylcarbamoyladenosine biosynthesis protein TsaB
MLLALDTATRQAGLALYDGEAVRAEVTWISGVHHTEWVAPAIEEALKRIRATAADLTAVAVTIGPGSFTGLRVALSLAKGIVAARDLPLLGIPTLDVTAYPHLEAGRAVCAVLQAGRGRLAYAFYGPEATRAAFEGTVPAIADVWGVIAAVNARAEPEPSLVVGELTPAEQRYLVKNAGERSRIAPPALAVRRPGALAELAWRRFQAGDVDDPQALEPLYLHLPSSGQR